ncbi:16S rRNA (guanine(527)-N(7))-methyltransferase RsmG [Aliiroseovarius sp. YM-037]|uniref:16S rRNA (guanine(527)-N(7))-methyltransferase RsmG n=1 Tax=Aliiroseovarius sp. YM-037 TaxID=3341728 RepID=UPI003A80C5C1
MERLAIYADLLKKWNPAINLVSNSSLDHLWTRHFLDSAQVFDLAPEGVSHWADLGAGGGFPGLVVAVIAKDRTPDMAITLVESDQRKATFLQSAAREMGLTVAVVADRIEAVAALNVDILSARALAPLKALLNYAERHLAAEGIALFPKGAKAQEEVDEALASWRFVVESFPSKTDANAAILKIGGITRV